MTQKLYTIYDSKGETYFPPFAKHTHGEAERDFAQLLKDEKSTVNQYPDDFDLFYLGEYDTTSGQISPLNRPQHIVKAVSLLNKRPSLDA